MSSPARPTNRLTTAADIAKVSKALIFFRVMAVIVGVGLLVLVLEMVLKYGFNNDVLAWWAMPHGFFYMIYLAATANLGLAVGWQLPRMVGIMLAGVVPFFSFHVENRVAIDVRAQLAAAKTTLDSDGEDRDATGDTGAGADSARADETRR